MLTKPKLKMELFEPDFEIKSFFHAEYGGYEITAIYNEDWTVTLELHKYGERSKLFAFWLCGHSAKGVISGIMNFIWAIDHDKIAEIPRSPGEPYFMSDAYNNWWNKITLKQFAHRLPERREIFENHRVFNKLLLEIRTNIRRGFRRNDMLTPFWVNLWTEKLKPTSEAGQRKQLHGMMEGLNKKLAKSEKRKAERFRTKK